MSQRDNATVLSTQAIVVYRTVVCCMLLAVLWKAAHFWTFLKVYAQLPLQDEFFPAWDRANVVLAFAYLAVVSASFLTMLTRQRCQLRALASISCGGAFLLCIHQGSYNDATFVTAFWNSLWCVWFIHRCGADPTAELLSKGAYLANIILAMILLGGGIGKWTAEYWSGAVLYEIYFQDRDFWIFNWLRAWVAEPELRSIACWYSRLVIVTETSCFAALWLLPRHYAGMLAIAVFTAIACLSNFYLFSVVLSAIGLATVSLHAIASDGDTVTDQNLQPA
ncbi:hypothetical protein SH139x_003631 [Planctomycetaceae bacterium SH139]